MPDEPPARDGTAPVSVVIAAYDGEATIGDAIASVLAQTLPPMEIVVVDDGSHDGTPAVLDRIAKAHACLRCLRQEPNGGQAAALNRGVSAARGAFLAFLDADDVWMPDKLARQLARFATDPALDVVFGLAKQRWVRPGEIAREGPPVPARLPGAMLIRRAAFDRVGPFETRWRLGSVVDWYARAVDAKLRMDLIQEVVYERRIHGRNLGIVAAEHRGDYLEVVKAALDRRRRGDT